MNSMSEGESMLIIEYKWIAVYKAAWIMVFDMGLIWLSSRYGMFLAGFIGSRCVLIL